MSDAPQDETESIASEMLDIMPDIASPAAPAILIMKLGIAVMVSGLIGVTAYKIYSEKENTPDTAIENIDFQGSIPTDYFPGFNKKDDDKFEKPPEEIEETQKPKVVNVAKKTKTAKKGKKAAKQTKTLTSKTVNYAGSRANNSPQVMAIQEARRKGWLNRVRVGKSFEYINTQEDFGEGVGKDLATYPVNLERTLTVDRNIPCLIIEEVESTLQGKVRCQVEHHVFAAHGNNILIPAGSKAIGFYEALQKPGDTRINIAWTRLITPEGININTTDNRVADQMGRSGVTGDVDSRFWERYGMTLLMTAISTAATLEVQSDNQASALAAQGLQQDLATISNTILQENINLAPKVYIPAGSRVMMTPVVDIWFKKPKKNQIQLVAKRGE